MAIENRKGYVTFADILGWKGIWQTLGKEEPIEKLLRIHKNMKECVDKVISKYCEYLFKNEMTPFFDQEGKIVTNAGYEKMVSSYINGKINQEGVSAEERKQIREDEKRIKEELEKFRVDISIELISDTFVITSSSLNFKYETLLHTFMAQNIVVMCLQEGLLVRGATSYGDYYKEKLIFVGPAIDDAASWHELGEEIGIYFTPKAMLLLENKQIYADDVKMDNLKLTEIIKKATPELKVNKFETYMVDWSSVGTEYASIALDYDTILPGVHKKIMYSKNRLDKFQK